MNEKKIEKPRVCGKCQKMAEKFIHGLCEPCNKDFEEWEKSGLKNGPGEFSKLGEGAKKKPWIRERERGRAT